MIIKIQMFKCQGCSSQFGFLLDNLLLFHCAVWFYVTNSRLLSLDSEGERTTASLGPRFLSLLLFLSAAIFDFQGQVWVQVGRSLLHLALICPHGCDAGPKTLHQLSCLVVPSWAQPRQVDLTIIYSIQLILNILNCQVMNKKKESALLKETGILDLHRFICLLTAIKVWKDLHRGRHLHRQLIPQESTTGCIQIGSSSAKFQKGREITVQKSNQPSFL